MLAHRHTSWTLVACFVGLASGPTAAVAEDASAALDYTLPNGLQVVLAPDPSLSDVALAVTYRAGAAHDPRGYAGLTHLVEHLTYRGSRHLKPLEGVALLERIGAGWNGYTELEKTVYFASFPANALETALWLESERMAFTLDGIDQPTLDVERRVVENETRERSLHLGRILWEQRFAALYGGSHPFTPSDDPEADLGAIDLRGVQGFFQRAYRPDNATVVLVGGFDAAQARALVAKYFATVRNPPLPVSSVQAAAPRLCGPRRIRLGLPFLKTRTLSVTWVLPRPANDAERAALELIVELTRRRLGDRLIKRTFEASAVDASFELFATHGLVTVDVDAQHGADWDSIEAAIEAEVGVASQGAWPPEDLRTARASLRSRELSGLGSALGRAIALVEGEPRQGYGHLFMAVEPTTLASAAHFLSEPHLVVRAESSQRASTGPLVLDDEGACP